MTDQTQTGFGCRRLARAEGEYVVELMLYEVIGDPWGDGTGIGAKAVADELKKHKNAEKILVRINSPGGIAADGAAIYNMLRRHKAVVEVDVDGMALSAASIIAMAGDTVRMAANAMMMIHEAWAVAVGGADDMLKAAESLGKLNAAIATNYKAKAGEDTKTWLAAMAEETWYTADEAVAAGLADEVVQEVRQAAMNRGEWSRMLNQYRNIPAGLAAGESDPGGMDAAETEEIDMAEKPTPAAEAAKAELDKARNDATAAERQLIALLNAALGQPWAKDVLAAAIADGSGVDAAKAAALDAAVKHIGELEAKAADSQKRLDAIASGGGKPVAQDGVDDETVAEARAAEAAKAAEPAKRFASAVAEGRKAGKTQFNAVRDAQAEDEAGYKAWLAVQQRR
jgi:ATP-dependent protease ClpP protease subunit